MRITTLLLLAFILGGFLNPTTQAQSSSPATVTLSPETGFYVESADEFMGFRISTRLQQQASFSAPLSYNDALQPSFLMRRARIRVHGYFFEKKLTYFVQTQMDKGNFLLSNAEFRWKATDNLQINMGQLWPAAGRQFRTPSEAFQMVDRSPVSRFFWPNYDIGILGQYQFEAGPSLFKTYLSITHGEGMNKPTAAGGMAYTGRLEWLPFGAFKKGGDYRESDLAREETPKLSLGSAYYHNQDAYMVIGGNGTSQLWQNRANNISALYVDGVFKYDGFSLLAEYALREVDNEIIESNNALTYSQLAGGQGFSIQGGTFISDRTEPTFRFSYLDPNNGIQAARSKFLQQNTYSLGLNHFIRGHHLKIQLELNLVNEEYQQANDVTYLQFLSQFSISF